MFLPSCGSLYRDWMWINQLSLLLIFHIRHSIINIWKYLMFYQPENGTDCTLCISFRFASRKFFDYDCSQPVGVMSMWRNLTKRLETSLSDLEPLVVPRRHVPGLKEYLHILYVLCEDLEHFNDDPRVAKETTMHLWLLKELSVAFTFLTQTLL